MSLLEFTYKETKVLSRGSAFFLSAFICWVMLPVILVVVAVVCAIIPIIALIEPKIIKIKGKGGKHGTQKTDR